MSAHEGTHQYQPPHDCMDMRRESRVVKFKSFKNRHHIKLCIKGAGMNGTKSLHYFRIVKYTHIWKYTCMGE